MSCFVGEIPMMSSQMRKQARGMSTREFRCNQCRINVGAIDAAALGPFRK